MSIAFSCIKPFDPAIEEGNVNKLVVSGRITNQEGWQEVSVSLASPVQEAAYIPVSGCEVTVADNLGNHFQFDELAAGSYQAWIGHEYLVPGTAFMVTMKTPEGELIESAYDTLLAGAELDTVYYAIENRATSDPEFTDQVMQFYTDLQGTGSESRNYRWEITETWEYHSAHPKEYYYNGKTHQIIPPDYSTMVCWSNVVVRDVFLLSTEGLAENTYPGQPLHVIDGHTSRLGILYSILVKQQAITENTYHYFEVVRENSAGFGGLYEKQPFSIQGNLVNLTNPGKDVLGFFYACSESSKRYFYHDIEGLDLDFSNQCIESPLGALGWAEFSKLNYPVYYYFNDDASLRTLTDECVDCRLRGGTTTKPNFWPN